MKAEFSEFTYGFSLVNELTKALSLKAVPIFPSLREEGKEGGGYDAKLLSKKGKILNLQFKLSNWMTGRNSRENRIPGHSLKLPYYRFKITGKRIPKQHALLRLLEKAEPLTFYAAPAFHLKHEINAYWGSDSVAQHSVFVKPSSISPSLNVHSVCFDAASIARRKAYLFSEPQEIEVLPFSRFSEFVIAEVAQETDTLGSSIIRLRERYASTIEILRHQKGWQDRSLWSATSEEKPLALLLEEILLEPTYERDLLRQVARISSGIFGAQAIAVVQE